MTTIEDSAEARWRAADTLAEGVADDGLNRRRSRVLAWVVALVVASWLIGFALAFLLPRPAHHASGEGLDARALAGLGLVLLTIGVAISTTLPVTLVLCGVATACFLFAGIQLLVYYRQMGVFLEEHAGRTDPPAL